MERPDGSSLNDAVCVRVRLRGGVVQGQSSRKCPSDEIHEQEKENNLRLKVLCPGSW